MKRTLSMGVSYRNGEKRAVLKEVNELESGS